MVKRTLTIFNIITLLLLFLFANIRPTSAWNDGPAPCGTLCCGPSGNTKKPVTIGNDEWCCETSGDTLCHYACSNQYYQSTYCVRTCPNPPPPPPPPPVVTQPPGPSACPTFGVNEDCSGVQVSGTVAPGQTITLTAFSKAPQTSSRDTYIRNMIFHVQRNNAQILNSNPVLSVQANPSELPRGYSGANGTDYFKSTWSYRIPDIVNPTNNTFSIKVENTCARNTTQSTQKIQSEEKQGFIQQLFSGISNLFNASPSRTNQDTSEDITKSYVQTQTNTRPTGESAIQLKTFYPEHAVITPIPDPNVVAQCAQVQFRVN